MNKISIMFTMDAVKLTDEGLDGLRALLAEWVILNEFAGRYLIDALITPENLLAAQNALAAYHPNIIGQWDESGALISGSFDEIDYVAHLPPIISIDANQNQTTTPRIVTVEIHHFGGWAARSLTNA